MTDIKSENNLVIRIPCKWFSIRQVLPCFNKPVILGWINAPWKDNNMPGILFSAVSRVGNGTGWFWREIATKNLMKWSKHASPDYWLPRPKMYQYKVSDDVQFSKFYKE